VDQLSMHPYYPVSKGLGNKIVVRVALLIYVWIFRSVFIKTGSISILSISTITSCGDY